MLQLPAGCCARSSCWVTCVRSSRLSLVCAALGIRGALGLCSTHNKRCMGCCRVVNGGRLDLQSISTGCPAERTTILLRALRGSGRCTDLGSVCNPQRPLFARRWWPARTPASPRSWLATTRTGSAPSSTR